MLIVRPTNLHQRIPPNPYPNHKDIRIVPTSKIPTTPATLVPLLNSLKPLIHPSQSENIQVSLEAHSQRKRRNVVMKITYVSIVGIHIMM